MLKPLLFTATVFLILQTSILAQDTKYAIEQPIVIGEQRFNVNVAYDTKSAWSGNTHLKVTVEITTAGQNNLKLERIEAVEQPGITFSLGDRVELSPTPDLSQVAYDCAAKIADNVEPRAYLLRLGFSSPNNENVFRQSLLYVGTRKNGKLSLAPGRPEYEELLTGKDQNVYLQLENNFPDYTVSIKSIEVSSDPSGIIIPTEQNDLKDIPPFGRETLKLNIRTAPFSLSQLISGFNDQSSLIVAVKYEDGHGRTVSDFSPALKIRVRPKTYILILAMVIGVLIGAVIKLYLQHLQQQGVITRREKLAAMAITCLIGCVVAFISLVGKIKIIAFAQTGSYDNPAVIFLISLAGAVGGTQLLSSLLKLKNPTNPERV
jgi:hypothetical protein